LNVEMEVRDFIKIPLQHLPITGQPEPLAVAGDVLIDEPAEVRPVLLVEAGDVGSIDVGEGGFGHGRQGS
jgi:hypothetical protein